MIAWGVFAMPRSIGYSNLFPSSEHYFIFCLRTRRMDKQFFKMLSVCFVFLTMFLSVLGCSGSCFVSSVICFLASAVAVQLPSNTLWSHAGETRSGTERLMPKTARDSATLAMAASVCEIQEIWSHISDPRCTCIVSIVGCLNESFVQPV